jgi:hypothetical protein
LLAHDRDGSEEEGALEDVLKALLPRTRPPVAIADMLLVHPLFGELVRRGTALYNLRKDASWTIRQHRTLPADMYKMISDYQMGLTTAEMWAMEE